MSGYNNFFLDEARVTPGLDGPMPEEYNFREFMRALSEVSPAPIYIVAEEEIPGGRNACYSHAENKIFISERNSPAMMVRAALHELVHATLHPWPDGVQPDDEPSRAVRETEAEGVAWCACIYYGVDVTKYSLGYILSWARHLTAEEAARCEESIHKTTSDLISAINKALDWRELAFWDDDM